MVPALGTWSASATLAINKRSCFISHSKENTAVYISGTESSEDSFYIFRLKVWQKMVKLKKKFPNLII